MGVTGSGKHLKYASVDREQRDIKRTTAQIVHDNLRFALLLVQTVGDSGGGGLVHNAEHLETSNRTSVLSGSALSVVEVCRHSDDGVRDLVAKVCLSGLLHLLKHHSADFFRREHLWLAVHRHLDGRLTLLLNELEGEVLDVLLNISLAPLATNETLRVKDRVLGVLGGLVLSSVTNETLVILGESHVRGCNTVTLVIGNNFDTALTLYTDT